MVKSPPAMQECMGAKSLQSCPTLCDSVDSSQAGSFVPGQEYWSGLPFPPPGDLPDPGIEPGSRMSPALAGWFFTTSATWAAMQEMRVQFLGWEDPLEEEMATHSSILAYRIPWTEELGRLQSMESQTLDTTEHIY